MTLATISTIATALTGFSLLFGMLFGLIQRFARFAEDWYGGPGGTPRSVMERLSTLEDIAHANNAMLQTHLESDVPAMTARGQKLIAEYNQRLTRIEQRLPPPP